MLTAKKMIRCTVILPFIILVLFCVFLIQSADGVITDTTNNTSLAATEAPIYPVSLSENTQQIIWRVCHDDDLSYELVLAKFEVDDYKSDKTDDIKAAIEKLAYYRDYWSDLGYSDEIVFDLMLVSDKVGIDGCMKLMKDEQTLYLDYIQKVAETKYDLEQSR